MASWKWNAGALATAMGALTGAGVMAVRRAARGPLPQTGGVLRIVGLQDEVIIDRDAWGIPHIAASSVEDLFFANGFVHAQDRLWQMELNRRVGSGRLSELFGQSTIAADRLMRHLGLRRVAEEEVRQLDSGTRAVLDAYCRGVNSYLDHHQGQTPLEFFIVRALPLPPMPRWRPEPWTIADTLVFAKTMSLGLCSNWSSELVRAAVLERLGPERAAALEPAYAREHPVVIPGTDLPRSLVNPLAEAYAELQPFLEATGVGAGGFSNNWVVDGSRTASGKPMLANDPHLGVQMPSTWYEIELQGPGYDVAGASFPGVPGVIIGHNGRIAWGVTAACLDVQDLVIEQVNPANPRQYLYEGTWRDGTLVREEIGVRGRAEPVVDEVLITHHGPIISAALTDERRALAMRWTALQPGALARAVLGYNRAANWPEFVEALRDWDAPSHNFVYGDVDGNIGYYTPGVIPIRSKGSGAVPVPGWTGEYEWIGTIPFEELPHAYNPSTHQIITANNRLVTDSYPYNLGSDWLAGYRAQRIHDMLGEHTGLTIDDFRRMQLDVLSLPGLASAGLLRMLDGESEIERSALSRAAAWDGNLTVDSVGGCICVVYQHHLLRAVFGPVLGDLTEIYLGQGTSVISPRNGFYSRAIPLLYELAQKHDDRWFTRMGAPNHTWAKALRGAFGTTIAFLRERLGEDLDSWRWGRINMLHFNHPLGRQAPLDRVFSRGPVAMGGDDNTVAAAVLPLHSPHDQNGWAASYRQIVDLGRLGDSLSMHTTGQSGHVMSEHYDDMIPAWREGRYHPMSLPLGDIRRELGGHLVLEPTPEVDGK